MCKYDDNMLQCALKSDIKLQVILLIAYPTMKITGTNTNNLINKKNNN